VIIAPLVLGDAPLGVLRLDGPVQAPAFRERPQELLQAFAGEAALTLQRLALQRAAARSEVLEEASEAKTSLMMSLSHDLKTPLAAIKASVSSLLDNSVDWPEADVRAFLETIDSQVDRLDRTISDILDLNRLESGGVRPLLRQVEARDLLEDARERCLPLTRGRTVEVEAPPGLTLVVDPSLAVQALVNLLENAAKYSPESGRLLLSASARDGEVELAVEDEGPGISQEDLPRVFERFYRLPRSGGEAQGTGLGLALVKAFTTLSGGSVDVASGPSGSRFSLRFPAGTVSRGAA
jgi:two-component system sensor histidine kinase KdpD